MKQDFTSDMLYDQTDNQTEITTPQTFDKADLTEKEEEIEEKDAVVEINALRTQVMRVEDFVHMFRNKVRSIDNIDQQIQGVKQGMEEYIESYEDEIELMKKLDKEKKSETGREPVPANSLTQHHMEAYKKIQNEEQQIEELESNREDIMQQIDDLWPVMQDLIDEGQPVPKEVANADFLDTSDYDTSHLEEEAESEEIETEDE